MLGWLIEPLEFEFMRNAIMTAILLGILSAVVGTYLIVQRMGLLGDVIAHAVLPGLAIALRVRGLPTEGNPPSAPLSPLTQIGPLRT